MQKTITHWIALSLALLCCLLPLTAVRSGSSTQSPAESNDPPEAPLPPFDTGLTLQVLTDDGIREMDLRTYLIGVLLAETPASFEFDAIKAQAVASRTFALQQARRDKHENAHVCSDSTCCQGWTDPASSTGHVYALAVDETDGLVVTYDDALIEATFFSCSGGQTEDAAAVWGSDIPYLQSVTSPGEEAAPRFSETIQMPAADLAEALRSAHAELLLPAEPTQWFGSIVSTAGGGIDTIQIGNVRFTGMELRSLLHLRSTDITFSAQAQTVYITTRGYGHRVGLSQYGAQALALDGADFEAILLHYYQNTKIQRLFLAEQP